MKKKRLYDILLGICIVAFLVSGGMLMYQIQEQKKNDSRLEDLSDLVMEQLEIEDGENGAESIAGTGKESQEELLVMPKEEKVHEKRQARVRAYDKIKEQNPDLVGWIKIEGTKIDYPVLQSIDRPNFYLNHDFDQKSSIYGAPYVAEECDLTSDCRNILIYGHHMKNGSMFAALDGYLDEEFWDSHGVIQFDTLKEYGNYQVAAVFSMSAVDSSNPLYDWITAGTEESFTNYVSYIKQHSVYDKGVDIQWGDHLISLITCEYTHQDGRLIVVAKRIENTIEENGKKQEEKEE